MLLRNKVIGPLVSLVFVLGLLGACSPAAPPMVSKIHVEPSTSIPVGEKASLTIEASGTGLQFKWTVTRGSISSPTTPSVTYTAPDSPGPDTMTVEVTGRGGSTVRSITFEVVVPPTPPPIPTPPPTPDCRDIQVSSYLELDLATGTRQRSPDASGVVVLTTEEISGLVDLSGRAILAGPNVKDCTCYWEVPTEATPDPWKSVNGLPEDCSFRVDLPTEVMTLRLTIGERVTLFTVKVHEP